MIRAQINQHDEVISGFKLTGHAGFSEEGQDIVCAAVSVLSINTVNALEKLAQAQFDLKEDSANGGYLELTLSNQDQKDPKTQLLLETLALGLSDIEESYPEYIRLKINKA